MLRGSCHGLLAVALAATVTGAAAGQPDADSRIAAELTLEAQLVKVSFPPALSAADGSARALLSGSGSSRVRVATLEADRALRIGSIVPGSEPAPPDGAADTAPAAPRRDLWLARTAGGWELQASGAGGSATVPLAHRTTDLHAPTFVAALHPTGAEAGRLVMRWGAHVWSAEFRFDELPPAPAARPDGNFGEALERDSDTSATARLNTLAERNETALVLPGGERMAVLFGKRLAVDGVDYPNLAATPDGGVVALVRAPVVRLRSAAALRFGATELPTGNLSPGFPGSYGLWLKRAGAGWRFVFNNEPDSWGTQHDPAFDAAEVAAEYTRAAGAFRPLGVTLVAAGANAGRLVVHWGPHEWAADFSVLP